jgi:hypothetical protein
MDQAGRRRAKAARPEIEGCELGLEVDVKPLASRGPGVLRGDLDCARSDAPTLVRTVRLRVDEERVVAAVGYDVDEPYEASGDVAGSDPAQTVWTDSIPPADLGVSTMGIDELNHLRVGQRPAPAVRDAVGDDLGSKSAKSQQQSGYPAEDRNHR